MKRKIISLLLAACMVAGFIPLLQINAQAINTEAVFNNGSAENSTIFSNAQTNIEQTYAEFIINKGYLPFVDSEESWSNTVVNQYAYQDINQDGIPELFIKGPESTGYSSGWFNVAMFSYQNGIVHLGNIYIYGGIRYSVSNRAICFTNYKPTMTFNCFLFYGLEGNSLTYKYTLAKDTYNGQSSPYSISNESTDKQISESEYQSYFAGYEYIEFNDISDIVLSDDDPSPFVDVQNHNEYYYTPVLWAVENNITYGTDDTHFSPNQSCTRSQVVAFLWRAMGSPAPTTTECPFVDVKSSDYFYNAILWAVENGITYGTDDTHFSPDATVTRADFVTFLWRAEKRPSYDAQSTFVDIPSDSYYAGAVLWAAENKVAYGVDDTHFAPAQFCTRGQVVSFLYRDLA